MSGLLRRHPVRSALVALVLLAAGAAAGWYAWERARYQATLAEARQALDHHDNETALRGFERCLAFRPGDGTAHLLAARAARRAGRFDVAESHLKELGRLDPDGRAATLEQAVLDGQRGTLDATGASYLTSLATAGGDQAPLALEGLAEAYRYAFQIPRALDCVERWLKVRPDDTLALTQRGWLWRRMRAKDNARADYARAVELDPEYDAARLRLAEVILDLGLGTVDEAAGHLERLADRRPDDPAVLILLARCRSLQGRTDEAAGLLDRVLGANPHDVHALLERGRLALQAGLFPEAEKWLRQAVDADPHNRDVLAALASCYRFQGKVEEAKRCEAQRAQTEADLKRLDQLLQQVALGRVPDPNPRCELGELLLRQGRESEALKWFGLALQLDPAHARTHAALAGYYERTGRPDLARPHRQLAGPAGSGGDGKAS